MTPSSRRRCGLVATQPTDATELENWYRLPLLDGGNLLCSMGQMNRRELITVLGSATMAWPAAILSPSLPVEAQQAKRAPHVGFLVMGRHPAFPVFVQGLNCLGWVEGQNVVLEPRFAELGKPEQFDRLAVDSLSDVSM
jgi:hypothetical protein